MILDKKHALQQKLFRQFAETEFTKEILDELERPVSSTGKCIRKWPSTASWELRSLRNTVEQDVITSLTA